MPRDACDRVAMLEKLLLLLKRRPLRKQCIGPALIRKHAAEYDLRGAHQQIALRNAFHMDAGGVDDRERLNSPRVEHGKLERNPAAERLSDKMDPIEAQR